MQRTVLVTGGAGFIGSALARALLARGERVIIADNFSTGYKENLPTSCQFVDMDLGNRDEYVRLSGCDFDAVFHVAGQSSGEVSFQAPWYDFTSHAASTLLLLELCRTRAIRRFLYASSMAVYGDPEVLPVSEQQPTRPKSFYAAAKLAAEAYAALFNTLGVHTTVFRMFSVYGPHQNLANKQQGMASIYLSYLLEGTPIIVKGSPQRFRDFVFIDDVVEAWLMAMDEERAYGRVYNVGSGVRTTVRQLLDALTALAGIPDHPIEFAPGTPGDQFGMVADVTRIRTELGWLPRHDLRSGLTRMLESHRAVAGERIG